MAPVGVIEVPRVQLNNGLFRTMEKPTSVSTDQKHIANAAAEPVSSRVGRPKAGGELNRIGTFGGADISKWHDTDKRTKIG